MIAFMAVINVCGYYSINIWKSYLFLIENLFVARSKLFLSLISKIQTGRVSRRISIVIACNETYVLAKKKCMFYEHEFVRMCATTSESLSESM